MNYLYSHFKDKYRVIADYDQSTNDFPRDVSGAIDRSFDDYYIPSHKNLEVRHAYRDILTCFIWSIVTAGHILRDIYELHLKKPHDSLPAKDRLEKTCLILRDNGLITSYSICDGEMSFSFKSEFLPQWEQILKLRSWGKKIRPLSPKNLPKSKYKIPTQDTEAYKNLIKKFTKMEADLITVARKVRHLNKCYQSQLNTDVKQEMRSNAMTFHQYIHSHGRWSDYLTYLEEYYE